MRPDQLHDHTVNLLDKYDVHQLGAKGRLAPLSVADK